MKIIIVSLSYLPNVGGLENVIAGLSLEFAKRQHDLIIYTNTKAEHIDSDNDSYKIIRKWNLFSLICKVYNCDILLEANISLKTVLAGLLYKKKWFVTHQLPYSHDKGWKGKLKDFFTYYAKNISCSEFIRKSIKGISIVIPNFYDPQFRVINHAYRERDLIFVGRLVSDKGCDLLIDALYELKCKKHTIFSLTIVGEGPEKIAIEKKVESLGLKSQVNFVGIQKGETLVELLNQHKVICIPSKWEEPFGIVALEALACGCEVICADSGGLPEAAGPSAHLFRNNDTYSLVSIIHKVFHDKNFQCYNFNNPSIMAHLEVHQRSFIAQQYLNLFNSVINK